MSFYRSLIVAVAAMGLATSVFAADENAAATSTTTEVSTAAQAPADATQADAAQPADAKVTETTTTKATDTTTVATAQEKLDLNKATAKELMKVKGLSAAKAKAIVTYRKQHGDFKSIEDLKEVKGFKKMNEKTMKKIEDQLAIG